jgi:hypothetical protein
VFDNERHEGPRGRQQCTVLPGNQGEVLTHPRPAVDTRTQPDSLPISGDRFPLSATRQGQANGATDRSPLETGSRPQVIKINY